MRAAQSRHDAPTVHLRSRPSPRGDRQISLDQRGHGLSQWATPPAYATEDFAADLIGVLDALEWRHAVVIGHSMGGHNALAFAAWYPERVRGLVVVDSGRRFPRIGSTVFASGGSAGVAIPRPRGRWPASG